MMDGQCQGNVLDVLVVYGDQRNGARDLKGVEGNNATRSVVYCSKGTPLGVMGREEAP